jgi:energy-coupling factor transport system substrate-specific component
MTAATGSSVTTSQVRFHWRSSALLAATSVAGIAAFTWPLFARPHGTENGAHVGDAPWIFVALVPLLVAILLSELADGALDAKAVAMLGVLVACGAALRAPSTGVTGFTGVFFLLIPGGRVFGRGFGFVQGALTMFASALLTGGVGPWLPFEMLCTAWVGFFAGCLPRAEGRTELALLATYGGIAGLAYGLVMDMWFWPYGTSGTQLHFVAGAALTENLRRFWAFHLASALGFDIPRAAGNVLLVLIAGTPVLAALRRAARRAAFGAPVVFAPVATTGPGGRHDERLQLMDDVAIRIEPDDRRQTIVREDHHARGALDDERDEQALGAGAEHADQPLHHRGPALQADEWPVPGQRGLADDVGIEHLHELGDVAARARGDETLRE